MRARSFVAVVLIFTLIALVGAGLVGIGAYWRSRDTRGWVDPAAEGDLPFRQPLPGVNVELTQYAPDQLEAELNQIARIGFVWLRQTFSWAEIEPTPGAFDFSLYDPLIKAVQKYPSLRLVAVLDSAPDWARRPEASDRLFAPPQSMAAFARFGAEVAKRYGAVIDHYQVWDEPNLNTHWGGLDPRPADYAAMLKAVYPALKANDPEAVVITAGFAPTVESGPRNLSDVLFLEALYAAGAADSFDAVAGKPYGFDFSPLDRTVDPNTLNFSRLILLREVMVKHGDGHKPLWGSHFGWNSLPDSWTGPPSIWGQVDAATQGQYVRAAYDRARQEWAWAGGLILQAWQPDAPADDPIQGFAVRDKAAAWFDQGAYWRRSNALEVGLYPPTDPRISYLGKWQFGQLGADVRIDPGEQPPSDGSAHQFSFDFVGHTLGFKVRRGDFTAYLYVRVDGQPANGLPRITDGNPVGGGESYIILKSPLKTPMTEMISAARFDSETHRAVVRAYLGYDQWILAGIGVGSPPDTSAPDGLMLVGAAALLIGVMGGGITVWGARQALKPASRAVLSYSRRMSDLLGAIGVSLVAAVSMAITLNQSLPELLRRDLPALLATAMTIGALSFSPALPLTLFALLILWLLIYNRPLIGLALVVFWSPFFLAPLDLHVYALPMVELATLITLSAVLVKGFFHWMLRKPQSAPLPPLRWSAVDGGMVLMLILGALSLTWSGQINPATRELRILLIEPLIFYALLRTARLRVEDWQRLVDVLLIAGAAVVLIGLVGFVTGGSGVSVAEQGSRRLMSVYTSANNLALFLGRCLPFGVALILFAPGRPRKIGAGILTLIIGAGLVFTQSAGALILGLPAGLAVVALLWDRRRGLIVIGVLGVLILALIPLSRFVPRLQGALDLSRSSSFVRVQLWTSALNLIREHPITGAGLDQFLYLYRSRYILPEAWQEPDLSHPHNLILDFWIRLGIGGLIALGAIQWGFWRGALRGWRPPDALQAALLAGAMGSIANFLAHGLVDNSYFVTDLAYVFCFTVALGQMGNQKLNIKAEKPNP